MCLTKIHKEIKTADRDIPVYKVLTEDNFAPYIGHYRYCRGLNTPYALPPSHSYHEDSIDAGYLHAYTDELVARHSMEQLKLWAYHHTPALQDEETFKVVKMVVPKGEAYWLGDAYDIAATRLEWKENENE